MENSENLEKNSLSPAVWVGLQNTETPYTRYGNWILIFSLGIAVVFVIVAGLKARSMQ